MTAWCHVIWNSHAGTARQNWDVLSDLLRRDEFVVHQPSSTSEVDGVVREAVSCGAEVVVAAGGDGTLHSIVNTLAHTEFQGEVGAIPLGTGNDFCRNVGIPLNAAKSLEVILERRMRELDVIQITTDSGTRFCLNMVAGGNTAEYASHITEAMKEFWGPLVYVRGVIEVLTHLHPFHVFLVLDDESELELEALNIFMANGPATGGGLLVAPDATMDDGLIDVIVIEDCSPVGVASLAAQYTLSDYRTSEHVVFRQARTVKVLSKPPMPYSVDGELLSEQPIEFRIIPRMLRVLA